MWNNNYITTIKFIFIVMLFQVNYTFT